MKTRVTREIEGLALLVINQLYAQQTESQKLRIDDLLISSCCPLHGNRLRN